jgi:hypothetical protein
MVILGLTLENVVTETPEIECTKVAALSRIHCPGWSGHL